MKKVRWFVIDRMNITDKLKATKKIVELIFIQSYTF